MAQSESAISSSLEDYLEAIAEIIEVKGHAHTKDISRRLEVTMPSVTKALQALAARGLIDYRPHTPVGLTPRGAERAGVIRRRHYALRHFFTDLLKIDGTESDLTACKIEHVIGETVLSRMVMLSEAVTAREDCAGLRDYLTLSMPRIQTQADENLIPLDQLPEGGHGIVVQVAENLRGIKKFADLGLVPGSLLKFEGRAPFGDMLRVRVMGSMLSLRKRDAMYIQVKVTD